MWGRRHRRVEDRDSACEERGRAVCLGMAEHVPASERCCPLAASTALQRGGQSRGLLGTGILVPRYFLLPLGDGGGTQVSCFPMQSCHHQRPPELDSGSAPPPLPFPESALNLFRWCCPPQPPASFPLEVLQTNPKPSSRGQAGLGVIPAGEGTLGMPGGLLLAQNLPPLGRARQPASKGFETGLTCSAMSELP